MKYIFGNRQSGKTTMLAELYHKAKAAKKEVCIIVPRESFKKNFVEKHDVSLNDIFTFQDIKARQPYNFTQRDFKEVLIDEGDWLIKDLIPEGQITITSTPIEVKSIYKQFIDGDFR